MSVDFGVSHPWLADILRYQKIGGCVWWPRICSRHRVPGYRSTHGKMEDPGINFRESSRIIPLTPSLHNFKGAPLWLKSGNFLLFADVWLHKLPIGCCQPLRTVGVPWRSQVTRHSGSGTIGFSWSSPNFSAGRGNKVLMMRLYFCGSESPNSKFLKKNDGRREASSNWPKAPISGSNYTDSTHDKVGTSFSHVLLR